MKYIILLCSNVLFLSYCEDIIDLIVKVAVAKYIIEADIHNLSKKQMIKISQTTRLNDVRLKKGIDQARVQVENSKGQINRFSHIGEGNYINLNFKPVEGERYKLNVNIDGELFTAYSTMPKYVEVDTLGFVEENVFGKEYYFLVVRFQDPLEEANFYKYNMSVNNGAMEFINVSSDKFNNGLNVEHRLSNKDNDLKEGDEVKLTRSTIDSAVYKYWNEYQMTSLASASPGNPTSNISNGALGFFSVRNTEEYEVKVPGFLK